MGQGDIVDGMELIQFDVFVPSASGGFGGTFDNDRSFVAALRLRPLDAAVSGSNDIWGLYDLRVVVPEPSALGSLWLAAMTAAHARRSWRRRCSEIQGARRVSDVARVSDRRGTVPPAA